MHLTTRVQEVRYIVTRHLAVARRLEALIEPPIRFQRVLAIEIEQCGDRSAGAKPGGHVRPFDHLGCRSHDASGVAVR